MRTWKIVNQTYNGSEEGYKTVEVEVVADWLGLVKGRLFFITDERIVAIFNKSQWDRVTEVQR